MLPRLRCSNGEEPPCQLPLAAALTVEAFRGRRQQTTLLGAPGASSRDAVACGAARGAAGTAFVERTSPAPAPRRACIDARSWGARRRSQWRDRGCAPPEAPPAPVPAAPEWSPPPSGTLLGTSASLRHPVDSVCPYHWLTASTCGPPCWSCGSWLHTDRQPCCDAATSTWRFTGGLQHRLTSLSAGPARVGQRARTTRPRREPASALCGPRSGQQILLTHCQGAAQ